MFERPLPLWRALPRLPAVLAEAADSLGPARAMAVTMTAELADCFATKREGVACVLDAFGTAFPLYDTWNGNFRVEQAHNDYLQILADAGLLGFICIAAFIYLLFKQGLQKIGGEHSHFRRSVSVGAMAGCLGILIHSFFDFPLRTPSNAFFFLLFAVFTTASIHFSKRSRTRGKR